ncbi:hypothetical protein [Schaalia suimastitidis]|uniref:hypothetical protein n=1 Tax=Schaalia suimastitidis TaxID=121163 RepID=UPI00040CB6D1|nr:hypothetical protein [Schaalia suimastitidis]
MNLLRAVARPLLAAPFIVEGWDALRHPRTHVDRIHATGVDLDDLPYVGELDDSTLEVATRILGGFTLLSAVAFAVGKSPRTNAAILACAAAPIALVNAPVWTARTGEEKARHRSQLRLRGALVGAMLLASTDRQGKPSALWRLNDRHQRALKRRQRSVEVGAPVSA